MNDPEWFNLKLCDEEIESLRKGLRIRLTHQLYMDSNLILNKGSLTDKAVIKTKDGIVMLNLVPFFNITNLCVEKIIKTLKLNIIN